MEDKLEAIFDRLRRSQADLEHKQAIAGFDGFIDSIQKVIFSRDENFKQEYFSTIEGFGQYISARKTGGLSLETEELVRKIGGNVPVMANALAQFGVEVHCMGAFGYPYIDPVFSDMHENTVLHSFAEPGLTCALEFGDGKIMLARMESLNAATWEQIKQCIGLEQIIDIFSRSDMLCLLNWSEVRHSGEIWEGLLREIFPFVDRKDRMQVFFDLSDCSASSNEQIRKALELIGKFTAWGDVTLSLNKNEASLVYRSLHSETSEDPEVTGSGIARFLNIGTLILHTSSGSFAWKDSIMHQADTFLLKNPKILTGAGDNFNAGFLLGKMMELETGQSLMLANLVAAAYVKKGRSPGLQELIHFFD